MLKRAITFSLIVISLVAMASVAFAEHGSGPIGGIGTTSTSRHR